MGKAVQVLLGQPTANPLDHGLDPTADQREDVLCDLVAFAW
ncbi:MAG: hypothetical protein WCT04_14295 [Planctomycetota bacterium]